MRLRPLMVAILTLLWAQAGLAQQPAGTQQEAPQGVQVLPGGFLVIDQEALFSRSAFGKRILAETDKATKDLVAENHKIEAQLVAEEKDLTERRPKMQPDAFRKLADAFDQKVQTIRDEQNHKSDQIGKALDQHRREFYQAIVPVLADILRETRAVAILDKRTVLISVNLIDATDLAVARIDAKLGDGRKAQQAVEQQGGAGNGGAPAQGASPPSGDAILGPGTEKPAAPDVPPGK
jgi:Skp family chaperone for outer membrane proteins